MCSTTLSQLTGSRAPAYTWRGFAIIGTVYNADDVSMTAHVSANSVASV